MPQMRAHTGLLLSLGADVATLTVALCCTQRSLCPSRSTRERSADQGVMVCVANSRSVGKHSQEVDQKD